jgi:acyl-CoA thioester hydrolase
LLLFRNFAADLKTLDITKMTEERRNDYRHVLPLQIRFNDVDKFGHVNNTVYFQFYDTAKTDYIATVCKGVDWERQAIVVVKIEAEFLAQIKGNDHIAGRTRIVKIGNKSFHLEQDVIDSDTQEVKSRCLSVMVLYDLERQQTIPLPDEWRKAITDYEGLENSVQ